MMYPYPFSALVGQEELQLALLLNAVSPKIGGVLVRGEKGTAKSTAARGLARILPPVDVVADCPFACDPDAPDPGCPAGPHPDRPARERRPVRFVELPVGATTDRVAGSIDLERALTEGRRSFEPGLLAHAHRGILYADEVNLLPDQLVDLLLDAAALGVHHVEREGVGVRHAARFILVGTMNPEEGELRPQLLDRFGLAVDVRGPADTSHRSEIVRRRLTYEEDPEAFARAWRDADTELAHRIVAAQTLLSRVELGAEELERISRLCAAFEVDGMRADIVTARAAMALAAWDGRTDVRAEDVRRAAALALPHRRRRGPLDEPHLDPNELEDALAHTDDDPQPPPDPPDGPGGGAPTRADEEPGAPDATEAGGDGSPTTSPTPAPPAEEPARPFAPRHLTVPRTGSGPAGRRSRSRDVGQPVGDTATGPGRPAVAGTLRAAAPHQQRRGRERGPLLIRRDEIRYLEGAGREGNLIVFVVDASGSMAARRRMREAKGAVLSLLLDAYRRRDRVGMLVFGGGGVHLALPPTASVDLAARRLTELETAGRTPLADALARAVGVLQTEAVRDPDRRPLCVCVTDGRPTVGRPDPVTAALGAGATLARRTACVVVDTEDAPWRMGICGELARAMDGAYIRLTDLRAGELADVTRSFLPGGRVA